MADLPGRSSYVAPTQMVVLAVALALLLLPSATISISIQACCILLLLHSVWALWSWRRVSGALFDPYALFMLSATLFNGGLALLEVFGLNSESLLAGFPPDVAIRSLLLVFAGLVGLHFGALLGFAPGRGSAVHESRASRLAMRMTGSALLTVSFVPLLGQLRQVVSAAASGGYMALYQQDQSAAGIGSALGAGADLVLPGICFVLAGSTRWRFERIAALAVLSVYYCSMLFAGARGHSTLLLVSVAWLWDRTVRPIPRRLIAAFGAILLSLVFPLIRATRELPASERTVDSMTKSYTELAGRPGVSGVEEMGGSVVTVAYTVELVPAYRPHDRGVGLAYALLTVVPSLLWNRHPYVARGTPSDWLIQTVDPTTAREGGGLGFSFIADAFLNFGVLGVPLVALLIGYGIVRLCRWSDGSAARLAVVATFMPYLLFSARSEIALLPRALVWYSLGPYLLYLFLHQSLQERKSTHPGARALDARNHEVG